MAIYLWAMLFLAADAPAWKGTSLDGTVTSGTIASVSAEHVVINTDKGEVKLPVQNLLNITPVVEPVSGEATKPTLWVELCRSIAHSGLAVRIRKRSGLRSPL